MLLSFSLFVTSLYYLHLHTQVRIGVLVVIEKIYDKLGESYMVLVPETIPYLSEVLEGMHGLSELKINDILFK